MSDDLTPAQPCERPALLNPEPGQAGAAALRDLQRQFPDFEIGQELTAQGTRYIARRAHPRAHPHTVITAHPDELRALLRPAPGPSHA